nr:hypothetical protein [Tanacetum cinerariifolium]
MTVFPEISRRACNKYHNLEDDAMVKNIFNLGKHEDGVGMKIPSWIIMDEMKLTDHYWMYVVVFGKSHDELEAKQNVQKVEEHLIAKEIEKLVERARNVENVKVDSSSLRQNDNPIVPDTMLEPRSDKKVQSYPFEHLKTRFMPRKKFHALAQHLQEGLIMEGEKSQTDVAKMTADAIQHESENIRSKISLQVNDAITNHIPLQVDSPVRNYMSGHILHVHPTQATPTSLQEQQQQLYLTIRDNPQLQQDDLPICLALKFKFKRLYVATTPCRSFAVRPRDQDDPHDDAHLEGENDAKRQKTSEHGTFVLHQEYIDLERVHDFQLGMESYQQKVNLTAPTITFLGIEKYKMFSIISEPVYGIIYKNSKKEKRVMRHQEIHKFYDATLKRVLEGLRSYNNDVKHEYMTLSLSKEDAEYLKLFKEETKERLKHHDQMR